MRLVTFTNLYPSEDSPRHGIFVHERLRHLVKYDDIDARVIALRPRIVGQVLRRTATSSYKNVDPRIEVIFQRVPNVPKLSNWIDPWTWANAAQRAVEAAIAGCEGQAVLDAHFLYPDGVAATILGRRLGVPVVMTARGSDVNVKCENLVALRWIRWAAARGAALITVSKALATKLEGFGVKSPNLEVIPNGVDLEAFRPVDSTSCRKRLGINGKVLVSVGHLIADKGHMIVIRALAKLPDTSLLVVGEGPEEEALRSAAKDSGVDGRVHFLGLVPHKEMRDIYSAADALVLMSAREGMPNVVLESLACGTRVVANDVGGVAEVVRDTVAGVVVKERSIAALVEGLTLLEKTPATSAATREYALQFDWDQLLRRQAELYRSVLDQYGRLAA